MTSPELDPVTKAELAQKLAREHGTDILDDVLGIAEAMETYDLTGDWQEMESLIREALARQQQVVESMAAPADETRFDVLAALTDGNPYVLLTATRMGNGGLRLNVDAGGSVYGRDDIIAFLEMALRHLQGN